MPTPLPTDRNEPAPPAAPAPARFKPSMAIVNFWLDAALFVAVAFVMWVSVMLQVVFPAPTQAAGWSLWGFTYDEWRNAQFFSLCVCALLAVEHVVLHWTWVCSIVATRVLRLKSRPDEGVQAVYGVGTFIVLLMLTMSTILAAMFAVRPPAP